MGSWPNWPPLTIPKEQMSDADLTLREAVNDLQSAYESMLNASTMQSNPITVNLILSLAQVVKNVKDALLDGIE